MSIVDFSVDAVKRVAWKLGVLLTKDYNLCFMGSKSFKDLEFWTWSSLSKPTKPVLFCRFFVFIKMVPEDEHPFYVHSVVMATVT